MADNITRLDDARRARAVGQASARLFSLVCHEQADGQIDFVLELPAVEGDDAVARDALAHIGVAVFLEEFALALRERHEPDAPTEHGQTQAIVRVGVDGVCVFPTRRARLDVTAPRQVARRLRDLAFEFEREGF